jgi:hypothetical protein
VPEIDGIQMVNTPLYMLREEHARMQQQLKTAERRLQRVTLLIRVIRGQYPAVATLFESAVER